MLPETMDAAHQFKADEEARINKKISEPNYAKDAKLTKPASVQRATD